MPCPISRCLETMVTTSSDEMRTKSLGAKGAASAFPLPAVAASTTALRATITESVSAAPAFSTSRRLAFAMPSLETRFADMTSPLGSCSPARGADGLTIRLAGGAGQRMRDLVHGGGAELLEPADQLAGARTEIDNDLAGPEADGIAQPLQRLRWIIRPTTHINIRARRKPFCCCPMHRRV